MKQLFRLLLLSLMIIGINSVGFSGSIEKEKHGVEKVIKSEFSGTVDSEFENIVPDIGNHCDSAIMSYDYKKSFSGTVSKSILLKPNLPTNINWRICNMIYKEKLKNSLGNYASNSYLLRKCQYRC